RGHSRGGAARAGRVAGRAAAAVRPGSSAWRSWRGRGGARAFGPRGVSRAARGGAPRWGRGGWGRPPVWGAGACWAPPKRACRQGSNSWARRGQTGQGPSGIGGAEQAGGAVVKGTRAVLGQPGAGSATAMTTVVAASPQLASAADWFTECLLSP